MLDFWFAVGIIVLAFLIPTRAFLRAKRQGQDIKLRDILTPPWKMAGWEWSFPQDGDPFHDTKIMALLTGLLMSLMLVAFGLLYFGTVALHHHLRWLGYPLLVLSLIGSLSIFGFIGLRLWVDFGRPFKRWWHRRHT